MKEFIKKLWCDNELFLLHIAGHGVKVIFSGLVLKSIDLIGNLLFSEIPPVIKYMEYVSTFGLLAIFFILVLFEIYDIICIKRTRIRRNTYE